MTMKINNVSARAACDAINALINAGAGDSHVSVYNGTRPVTPETAVGAQLLLVDFPLPDPIFPGAIQVGTNATATANAIPAATATDDGTATWFRVFDGNGVAVQDGDVSDTSGAGDMKLANVNIVDGITVTIVSWTATVPQG